MTGQQNASISIWQVKYGERVVRKKDVFHDYGSYGLPDGPLDMDYNYWLLRAADGSVVLVDTGYDISEHDWLGEISVVPTPQSLATMGVDPIDVDMVVTSHFHYDHIGYLGLFENARVVAARAERDHWFGKWERGELEGEFTTAAHLEPVRRAEREGRLLLVDGEAEVRPGVTVHPVGGHCPGELVVRVDTGERPVILASDAAHFYEQLEHQWPFFAFTDLQEMRDGLAFLRRLAADTGSTVVPGHDARTRARFPAAPGDAGAFATVIA
ncbi:N-acyl homoserine lactonase family protein [Microbacterium marinilacus]|uniref:N-acyl homoserine lactonase family protein n=1 Tax=Microbacterium marinilacus TaxID=415209 RepID=A0ABP7BKK2_9MICO|nr:N-acyl homoserine lactonase family protein [Microbacterium marinilacus]MBY0689728.1 N-acyl homoserine lactonase family protein [Microbacterium marinilacus]